MKDIDIYFLSLNSKIPEILSVALSNHIVVATLHYKSDPQLSTLSTISRLQQSSVTFVKIIDSSFPFSHLSSRMDNTRVKFDQLKNEILQSHNDTYQMIKLTDELSCACEKYSKVKDLFWKVRGAVPLVTPRSKEKFRIWIYSLPTSLIFNAAHKRYRTINGTTI